MQTRHQMRQQTLSVASLFPPETISMLASFLDAKSIGRFAVAVAPAMDRATKEAYLRRNFRLLEEHKRQPTVFRAFLEVNDDWATLYDDSASLSAADEARFRGIFENIPLLVSLGRVDIMRHLFEVRKVDVNATVDAPGIRFSCCPLYLSLLRGGEDMVRYVMSVPGLQLDTILHDVMREPEIKKANIELFLSDPIVDVNTTDPTGLTALHYLSMIICNRSFIEERLSLLLNHKDINVNTVDEYGLTPLHRAVSSWHREAKNENTVKFLIDAGADLNHPRIGTARSGRTGKGRTPLESASGEQVAIINKWLGKKKAKLS